MLVIQFIANCEIRNEDCRRCGAAGQGGRKQRWGASFCLASVRPAAEKDLTNTGEAVELPSVGEYSPPFSTDCEDPV